MEQFILQTNSTKVCTAFQRCSGTFRRLNDVFIGLGAETWKDAWAAPKKASCQSCSNGHIYTNLIKRKGTEKVVITKMSTTPASIFFLCLLNSLRTSSTDFPSASFCSNLKGQKD